MASAIESLNVFSKSYLFVDLNNRHPQKPFSSLISRLHRVILLVCLVKYAFFASGVRSDSSNYVLGFMLHYLEGARFWAAAICLCSAISLLSELVISHSWRHSDFEATIRKPIFDTINEYSGTLKNLAVLSHLASFTSILFSLLLDGVIIVFTSIETDMTPLQFLYCLFWTFQYATMGGCLYASVATAGIFLLPTCKTLHKSFTRVKVKLLWGLNTPRMPSFDNVLQQFDTVCADVKFYDQVWKKILFVDIIGWTMILGLSMFIALSLKLYVVLKVILIVCFIQVAILVSYLILSPASVNATARCLYQRFCALAARKQLILKTEQRIKL